MALGPHAAHAAQHVPALSSLQAAAQLLLASAAASFSKDAVLLDIAFSLCCSLAGFRSRGRGAGGGGRGFGRSGANSFPVRQF